MVEAELKSGFDERAMRSTLFCSCKMVENTRRQLSMLEAGTAGVLARVSIACRPTGSSPKRELELGLRREPF